MKMEDCVEVPSYFLCPISLQLMRDPVTVSTGITYDRTSIEKWLFSSKKPTCPITKQLLSESDLTPNHTLRRLIQAWCTLNASNGIERIPTPKSPIEKPQIVKLINNIKKFPQSQLKSLFTLKSIVTESERNRKLVAEVNGAVDYLAAVVRIGDDVDSTEAAVEILFNLKLSETHLKNLVNGDEDIIKPLTRILKRRNCQSRAYALMLLKSMVEVSDSSRLMNVEREFLREIVGVVQDQISQQASKSALKILMEVCPLGRNRIKAVENGAVSALIEMVLNSTERRRLEMGLIVLEQLCGCAEGREKLLEHGAGVAMVSKKILRVSEMADERAVRILWWICRYSGTRKVVKEMMEVGVVGKLCLVLQMDCSVKMREKAREILKMHSRVWNHSPCIPPHLLSAYPSS